MLSGERQYYLERFTPQILIASAFGPLLIPGMGVRLDQFVLYGILPISIGLFCVGRRSLISKNIPLSILFIFVFITIWALIVTVGGLPDHTVPSYRTAMDEFAAFENYFHTVALIIVLGVAADINNGPKNDVLLDRVGTLLILFMCLNAFIAISTIFFGPFPLARYFIPGFAGAGNTPFEVIADQGRFTGIFDVPSVAGAAYSITLFTWAYLTRKSKKDQFRNYLAGGILIVGGTLTISKIFIFGGIPLLFVYWFLPGRVSSRITLKLFVVLISAIISVVLLAELWVGLSVIDDLFTTGGDYTPQSLFIHFIQTRYSFGDGGFMGGIFAYIWDISPVQGLGFAYLAVADSAYLLYFMEGGMVSLLLYVVFIGMIIYLGLEEWLWGYEVGRFLTILGGFLLVAGVGAPIMTMPRVGVIFWTLLILCLAIRAELHSPGTRDSTPGRRIKNVGQQRAVNRNPA